MVNIESIRETFVPPIVAMIIAIGLVSDWSLAETPGSVVAPAASTATASRSSFNREIRTYGMDEVIRHLAVLNH